MEFGKSDFAEQKQSLRHLEPLENEVRDQLNLQTGGRSCLDYVPQIRSRSPQTRKPHTQKKDFRNRFINKTQLCFRPPLFWDWNVDEIIADPRVGIATVSFFYISEFLFCDRDCLL